MTLIVMMRSLSAIRADRWLLSAVRSDKCRAEIELILCCYRNAIYARRERLVTRITHDKEISFNIDNENESVAPNDIISFLNIINEM